MNTIRKFARHIPKESSSLKKLKRSAMESADGRFSFLSSDRLAIFHAELGFMEMIYHVTVYEPDPGLFNPTRMILAHHREFKNFDEAADFFESLT